MEKRNQSKEQLEKLYHWSYYDPRWPLRNFQYINVVRDKQGKLRSWEEYDRYAKAENFCDGSASHGWNK